MIKIILIDDHQIVRDGLKLVLNSQEDFRIIAEGAIGKDLSPEYLWLKSKGILEKVGILLSAIETSYLSETESLQKRVNTKVIINKAIIGIIRRIFLIMIFYI